MGCSSDTANAEPLSPEWGAECCLSVTRMPRPPPIEPACIRRGGGERYRVTGDVYDTSPVTHWRGKGQLVVAVLIARAYAAAVPCAEHFLMSS